MLSHKSKIHNVLNLRAGEIVEVRSKEEILSTLDQEGKLDALPFMPEMLKYCGKRMKVAKRAHKTCDTIEKTGARRMTNAVHLEGSRCDGEAHGGCQAECLMFWKEAWLKRVQAGPIEETTKEEEFSEAENLSRMGGYASLCSEGVLIKATRREAGADGSGEEVFSCQVTNLLKATTPIAWWDVRQYITDITSGNARVMDVINVFLFWMVTKTSALTANRAQLWLFNQVQRLRGGTPYPLTDGNLTKTPSMTLDLKPGELIQIKTQDEIRSTVNPGGKNRGLSFDKEMTVYCGGQYKVLRRVEKIINEKTGKMMKMPNDCIILEGVVCTAQYSDRRWLCPRAIYPYWREIWLKRVQ